jgi:dipeptidyl aminopeptidase/acylaminoacyl peptidase
MLHWVLGVLLLWVGIHIQAQEADRILYTSDETGNRELYTTNVNGDKRQQLTFTDAEEVEAAWSPDYSQIAFISTRNNGERDIYIMDASGGNVRQLTQGGGRTASTPCWSPDGQSLVFVSNQSGVNKLYSIAVSGGTPQALTNNETVEETEPSWSPDGRQIAYTSNSNFKRAIFVLDLSNGSTRSLISDSNADNESPAWSPDGQRLAFVNTATQNGAPYSEIQLFEFANGQRVPLTDVQGAFISGLSWSPNADQIAYLVVELRGGATSIVTTQTFGGSAQVVLAATGITEVLDPSWATPPLLPGASVANTQANSGGGQAAPAQNGVDGVVVASQLNVRSGPGPEYDELYRLYNGDRVTVYGRTSSGAWGQISNRDNQWVNLEFISFNGGISDLPVTFAEQGSWGNSRPTTGVRGQATTVLRVRGGPGANFQQLSDPDVLETNAVFEIVGRSQDGQWFQVNIDSRSAWVNANYVAVQGNINTVPYTD